jgi:hypothetical protein
MADFGMFWGRLKPYSPMFSASSRVIHSYSHELNEWNAIKSSKIKPTKHCSSLFFVEKYSASRFGLKVVKSVILCQ